MTSAEYWETYESNVQSYRSNSISSQSVLLTVGAICFEKSIVALILVTAIAMFQLWYIWFRVIYVRICIVDYYKHEIFRYINEKGTRLLVGEKPLSEHDYTVCRKLRKKANSIIAEENGQPKLKRTLRKTRLKLDVFLPASFSIIWAGLIIIAFLNK